MLEEGPTDEVSSQAFPDPYLSPCPSATELHSKLQSSEVEVKSKCEELSDLHGQLKEARAENSQLTERIRSIEALLEAGQAQDSQVSHFSGQLEEREDSPEQRVSHDVQPLHIEPCGTKEFSVFLFRPAELRPTSSRPGKLQGRLDGTAGL